MHVFALRLAPLLSLLIACGPDPGDGTASNGSTSVDPSGTSTSTTTGSTGTPTTGDASTSSTGGTGTGTGTTGTSTTTATGTTGPASVCEPQPEDVLSQFLIDDTQFPPLPLDFTEQCTVESITQNETLVIVLSGCKVDPDDPVEEPVMHTIDFTAVPDVPLDLAVGEQVEFSHFAEPVWWVNQAFALRRPADELVLAGLSVSAMPGEQDGPPIDFFAPLSVTLTTVCEPEPVPPQREPESGFIVGEPCVQIRREQLRFEWQDGAVLELIDHSTALWPDEPYRIIVGAAETNINIGGCADISDRYVRVLILRHQP